MINNITKVCYWWHFLKFRQRHSWKSWNVHLAAIVLILRHCHLYLAEPGQNRVLILAASGCAATHWTGLTIESGRKWNKQNDDASVRMFLIFSIRDKFDRGRKLKNFVFKTIVITVIFSLCLSWQYSPWTPILSPPPTSSSPPPAPSIICLHHEQTIAVVTYSPGTYPLLAVFAWHLDNFDVF